MTAQPRPCRTRWNACGQEGLTILEVVMSLTLFFTLFAGVFGLLSETSSFLGDNDADTGAQLDGNRAARRLTEILRKTGRSTVGGIGYPRVVSAGEGLEFRILEDHDGNGYAFDAATRELEWSTAIFRAGLDGQGNLWIFRNGAPIQLLARRVSALRFRTIAEDNSLHLNEIRVDFEVRRPTDKGFDVVHSSRANIHMRNG